MPTDAIVCYGEAQRVTRGARASIAGMLFAIAVGLVVFVVMAFLRSEPPTVDLASGHQAGQPVDLTVQTVGSIGYGVHPKWVSYLVKNQQGTWIHSTLWNLPADTTVHVTILQYDSGSPLRNQQRGLVTGVDGAQLNGKALTNVNSNVGNGVGHTFSVPALGINVPLVGVASNAKNFCNAAPCTMQQAHNTVTFTFKTPGVGQYHWQCFVPCGLGYLNGNGGPMQTIGYMDGLLKVVA